MNEKPDLHVTTCSFCGQTICDQMLDGESPHPAAYYHTGATGTMALCYKCMLAYQAVHRFRVWDGEITLYCHKCGAEIARQGDRFVCLACDWGFSIDDDGLIDGKAALEE